MRPQSLASLRALDVGGNRLRRVEALATCRGLSLMSSLNIAGNPVEAAQNVRHHVVHLLTQVWLSHCTHSHSALSMCGVYLRAALHVPVAHKFRRCLCGSAVNGGCF